MYSEGCRNEQRESGIEKERERESWSIDSDMDISFHEHYPLSYVNPERAIESESEIERRKVAPKKYSSGKKD